FAGMIELRAVHDDLRVQFCRQSRPGMKLGFLGHRAVICSPDLDGHVISTGVLAAVELDHGLDLALPKRRNQWPNPAFYTTIFPEIPAPRLSRPRGRFGLRGLCLRGCRSRVGREFLVEWCVAAGGRHKLDRTLRARAVPLRKRRA